MSLKHARRDRTKLVHLGNDMNGLVKSFESVVQFEDRMMRRAQAEDKETTMMQNLAMKDYANGQDVIKLRKDTLHEVPKQVTDYFKKANIMPSPPTEGGL